MDPIMDQCSNLTGPKKTEYVFQAFQDYLLSNQRKDASSSSSSSSSSSIESKQQRPFLSLQQVSSLLQVLFIREGEMEFSSTSITPTTTSLNFNGYDDDGDNDDDDDDDCCC
jgi:hypothetical protein